MISRIAIRDLRSIESLDFANDGNVILVQGPNASGKSTFADAAIYLLAGGTPPPVRRGAAAGKVEGILHNGYTIRRHIPADGKPTIRISKADGTALPGAPQKALDELLQGRCIDIDAAIGAKPAEQLSILLRAAGLEEELVELKGQRQANFEARTSANREATRAKARLGVPPILPAEAVSDEDLALKSESAKGTRERRREVEDLQARKVRMIAAQADMETRLHTVQDEVEALSARLVQAKIKAKEMNDELSDLGGDLFELEQQVLNAEAAAPAEAGLDLESLQRGNLAWKVYQDRLKTYQTEREDMEQLETEAEGYTRAIVEADAAMRALVAGIPGIEFDPETETLSAENLHGQVVPMAQLSTAETIVTMATLLTRLGCPTPILRIRAGSELDQDSLQALLTIAKQSPDTLFLIERIRDDVEGLELEVLS